MNRAEQLTALFARINALPDKPVNRREGVLAHFIGILTVISLSKNIPSDEIVSALERAVTNTEKEEASWRARAVADAERAKV